MAVPVVVAGEPVLGFQIEIDLSDYSAHPEVYVEILATSVDITDVALSHIIARSVRGAGEVVVNVESLGESYTLSGILWDFSSGTLMTVVDFEAPFFEAMSYSVIVLDENLDPIPDATAIISGSTLGGADFTYELPPIGFAIIQDPLRPIARVAGSVSELSSWGNQTNFLGSHRVIGRRDPVLVTDVASLRAGSFSMTELNTMSVKYDNAGPYDIGEVVRRFWLPVSVSFEKVDLWRVGQVLHFRSRRNYTGFDDMYFVANSVSHERVSGVVGAWSPPIMQHTINYIEVSRPSPVLEGNQVVDWEIVPTWADVAAAYSTWADVAAAYPTWEDLVRDQELT